MNKKLLPSELVDLLSANKGTTRKSSDAFVRGFFELIEDALQKESFVKIKGFGTFKLVNVCERESVKINTGERYQISGHSKITFTPDNTLKELINKPFSHFETVILPDSATNEDLEAIDTEFQIISEELEQIDQQITSTNEYQLNIVEDSTNATIITNHTLEDSTIAIPLHEEPEVLETNNNNPFSEISFQKSDEEPETIILSQSSTITTAFEKHSQEDRISNSLEHEHSTSLKDDSAINNEPVENVVATDQPTPPRIEYCPNAINNSNYSENTNQMHTPQNFKYKTIYYVLLTILLMVVSYTAGYYHIIPMGNCPNGAITELPEQDLNKEHTADSIIAETTIEIKDSVSILESLRASLPDTLSVIRGLNEADIELLKKGFPQVEIGSFYIIGTFKTHKLQEGETLFQLARKTYGHKDYVKYIILFNEFKNPDSIQKGTEIKLPWLVEKYGL